MQRSVPIANETEFQEWLLVVLEAEQKRLQKQIVAHDSRVSCPGKTKLDRQSEEHNGSTREK
jgi:hypothetical protein